MGWSPERLIKHLGCNEVFYKSSNGMLYGMKGIDLCLLFLLYR